jgi:hypothetical protein
MSEKANRLGPPDTGVSCCTLYNGQVRELSYLGREAGDEPLDRPVLQ